VWNETLRLINRSSAGTSASKADLGSNRSEMALCPAFRSTVHSAANVSKEPKLTDAASRMNVGFFVSADHFS
jgi:hypothetical protein